MVVIWAMVENEFVQIRPKLAQRQIMISGATKLLRQRERATNVTFDVNAQLENWFVAQWSGPLFVWNSKSQSLEEKWRSCLKSSVTFTVSCDLGSNVIFCVLPNHKSTRPSTGKFKSTKVPIPGLRTIG